MKVLVNNKKAYFNFEVLEHAEAGIVLKGWEVKSIKKGKVSIEGAYIKESDKELFINGLRIFPWQVSNHNKSEPEVRDRKLLMRKREIQNLALEAKKPGYTLVPLEIYQKDNGLLKIDVGLVKGKKKFDKRAKLKERDLKRRIESDRKMLNF